MKYIFYIIFKFIKKNLFFFSCINKGKKKLINKSSICNLIEIKTIIINNNNNYYYIGYIFKLLFLIILYFPFAFIS